MSDATERFSSRVLDYAKYRPSYPEALFESLERECGLSQPSDIADVGSGTGIATERLLARGHRVVAVEPNAAMRSAAERTLSKYGGFVSAPAPAEATGLSDASVDLVFAAQAFHWFDRVACRREFARITRPGGFCALAWNVRLIDASPFLVAYEELLRRLSVDYEKVNHTDVVSEGALDEFFAPGGYRAFDFPNAQNFDRDGLIGRARSSSYVPEPGYPAHNAFFAELTRIYEANAVDGRVRFEYVTRLYLGRVT